MTANAGGSLKAVDMVKVAEGGLRSLNNILEKFHQSYFLYLLVHTHKFVSVAYYMPVVGLLLAPLVVFVSFFCWTLVLMAFPEKLFFAENKIANVLKSIVL